MICLESTMTLQLKIDSKIKDIHFISKPYNVFFDRCGLKLKLLPKLLGVASDQVRTTFQLGQESIEKLREIVVNYRKNQGFEQQLRPSTYSIVSAYIFVCLVKARGGDTDRPVYLLVVVADCRSRLDPPVSHNYFGNCAFVHDKVLDAGAFMQENGVAVIAETIGGFIKGLEGGLLKVAMESHERIRSAGPSAGSPRFGYYEEDFGWGKQKKVEITSIDRIHDTSLMESRHGDGGIEIGIAMPSRHYMEAFTDLFAQGLH